MGCKQSKSTSRARAASKDDDSRTQTVLNGVPAEAATRASGTISNMVAFGAGCYWGTEKYITKDFQKKFPDSIRSAKVGFMSPEDQPRIKKPTYRQVCTGTSGHVEVLFVELNDPVLHFEELCRFFFSFHDPTLSNRQGNDRGFQYSSWIFYGDDAQFEIAKRVRGELQAAINAGKVKVFGQKTVQTKLGQLKPFIEAQEEHQQYLAKNPNGYCNHRIRLKQWYNAPPSNH